MKRTRTIHTPNLEAHRELSASPVPIQVPEIVKPPSQIDASIFKGWKPNAIQKVNTESKEKEFKSPLKTPEDQSKATNESRPTLPQFKPTELIVPGFENVAVTMPSEERIQLYKELRCVGESFPSDKEKNQPELDEEPISKDGVTEKAHLEINSSKSQEGLKTNLTPQSQNPKRLVYDPPRKTELEDLNGERVSTLTVKMFKNEVIQEHPSFGNRAKFRLTVNRVGLVEIYGKITKILESPTETIPRLVMLITDESSEDPLEAYYYDQDSVVLVNQINFSNWYQFVGQPKFQSDRTPILHLFSFREVVNLAELEYSKAMVKETLKYLPH